MFFYTYPPEEDHAARFARATPITRRCLHCSPPHLMDTSGNHMPGSTVSSETTRFADVACTKWRVAVASQLTYKA